MSQVAEQYKEQGICFLNSKMRIQNYWTETDNYRPLRKPLAEKSFHSYETFAPDKNMLKWLHTIISNAKAFVEGTYHGMERKHIQLYLDEFCYRFNRRS